MEGDLDTHRCSGHSLENYPIIEPGEYKGIWSGYFVKIIFANGKKSEDIEVTCGVRGMYCDCDIRVNEYGKIFVE